jgi:hypothetical protein
MGNKLRRFAAKARRIGAALNGRSRRGQSLIELTLTLPILLLLFFGMVEIGWYANNYLVLLDASREAGRRGATLDPITDWTLGLSDQAFRHDCCVGGDPTLCDYRNERTEMEAYYEAVMTFLSDPGADTGAKARLETLINSPFRYFDNVACQVLFNLPPLDFKWDMDEVIVSVFSYVPPYGASDYQPPDFPSRPVDWPFTRIEPTYPISGGRLPIERNQCLVVTPAENTIDHIGFTLTGVGDTNCDPSAVADPLSSNPETFCGRCDPTTGEYCANHRRADGCWGSEWDPGEIEERLYEYEKDGQTVGLSGGLVLVEVFWWHEQLLGMPFFSSLANPSEIYVWVMFPVSAAEPPPTEKP